MKQPAIPYIIDIEASGLGPGSYPIEIGLALERGQRYCSLIRPAPEWVKWDHRAEMVHRISRDLLLHDGRPVAEVAHQLNRLLEGKVVFSDAWGVDNPWIIELFASAGVEQRFSVSALEMILNEKQIELWSETRDRVARDLGLRRHRASNDALIIQETYLETMGTRS